MNNKKPIHSNSKFSLESVSHMVELQICVEQFYYYEAAALDDRRFSDWLDLFTEDTHYWMPIRRTVTQSDSEKEFTEPGGIALFDDSKSILHARIKKLESGTAWSENPPSRTRHLISNIRILDHDDETLNVASNFHLYRTRFDSEEDSWIGSRHDILVRKDDTFLIKRRAIYLDQTVILSQNLSSLF